MKVLIAPSVAKGTVNAPCSKSYAHRLLIAAALSDGTSVIENVELNEDITATIKCLQELGANIQYCDHTITVEGIKTWDNNVERSLFCNESGSTMRFLVPLSFVFSSKTIFTGAGRLMDRPQTIYEELFNSDTCYFKKEGNSFISGGVLKSGKFKFRGDISSQFITGLLFALPLLEGDSELVLTTSLQSEPYIDITIEVLKLFGVCIKKTQAGYFIKGNQKFKPTNVTCQGDWSNSAFLHAFNLCGGNVQVTGLDSDSNQGDKVYLDYYSKLSESQPVLDITECPDLGPVLIACACLKNGAKLVGTSRLKIKESDRGEAMRQELLKFGVEIQVEEDSITIPVCTLHAPEQELNCHNDHRIAMSLAVLCSVTGGTLNNAQCINKSYPDFFDVIGNLGIQVNRRCQK